jgi:hypothetical protein
MALVRDPAFQGTVNDIVIEFASRHHRPLLDRYMLECADVPLELRRVWRETSKASHSWESPLYIGWLEAVRDTNRKSRPPSACGCWPAIPRSTGPRSRRTRTGSPWGPNDVFFAKVVNEEVLAFSASRPSIKIKKLRFTEPLQATGQLHPLLCHTRRLASLQTGASATVGGV